MQRVSLWLSCPCCCFLERRSLALLTFAPFPFCFIAQKFAFHMITLNWKMKRLNWCVGLGLSAVTATSGSPSMCFSGQTDFCLPPSSLTTHYKTQIESEWYNGVWKSYQSAVLLLESQVIEQFFKFLNSTCYPLPPPFFNKQNYAIHEQWNLLISKGLFTKKIHHCSILLNLIFKVL